MRLIDDLRAELEKEKRKWAAMQGTEELGIFLNRKGYFSGMEYVLNKLETELTMETLRIPDICIWANGMNKPGCMYMKCLRICPGCKREVKAIETD